MKQTKFGMKKTEETCILKYVPGGSTLLQGLNGDVRPHRVWFSGFFVLNGVYISLLFVLSGVSLHGAMF